MFSGLCPSDEECPDIKADPDIAGIGVRLKGHCLNIAYAYPLPDDSIIHHICHFDISSIDPIIDTPQER
jgi:hypothetical protein